MSAFYVIDVFTERAYEGNPLAVVFPKTALEAGRMQAIAREFGFSETTFVTGERDGAFSVRIFTPTFEIPFAGHPTLGTATVLRERRGGDAPIALELGIGRVEVRFERDAQGHLAWLTPPLPELGETLPRERAAELLSLAPRDLDPDFAPQLGSVGVRFWLVPVAGRDALARAHANADALAGDGATGVFAFCREPEQPGHAIAARMFFESAGPREDPATGSACSCLGRWLLANPYLDPLPAELVVEQGFALGRPSLLHLRADAAQVSVGGRCVIVATGELRQAPRPC